MTDTTNTTPVAGSITSSISAAFSAITSGAVAGIKTLPYWADAAILGAVALWYLGVIDMTPRDRVTDAYIAGIAASLETVASKADIAELRATIAAQHQPAVPTMTTGSISKPKK